MSFEFYQVVLCNIYPNAGDLDIAIAEKCLEELIKNYNIIDKRNGWYIINDRVECVLDIKEQRKIL